MTGKMAMTDRGVFITIEGIDGCGKTTQARQLCTWLESVLGSGKVLRTFEPGGWHGGESLRRLLLEGVELTARTELLLFLADRSGHVDTEIAPALKKGQWVVCERYTDSTLAYQAWGRGISFDEIAFLLSWCRFPAPDLTFFLDLDENTARSRVAQRGGVDRFEATENSFMSRVNLGYRELSRRSPGRITVLNAESDIAQVAENIRHAVAARFMRKV